MKMALTEKRINNVIDMYQNMIEHYKRQSDECKDTYPERAKRMKAKANAVNECLEVLADELDIEI